MTTTPKPDTTPSPNTDQVFFSPYKDILLGMNWNTNVIGTAVNGSQQTLLSALPSKAEVVTWAFATGTCGSENWGGLDGAAVAAANVGAWVAANKKYIISTGGAAGAFNCTSDANFVKFINRYNSPNLVGIDFDIEAGQTQADIDSLVLRVKNAQSQFPHLRFSFTLATLGGNVQQSLGAQGQLVMESIKRNGLSNYFINLMTMDYGSTTPSNCVVSGGQCDMGQSAVQAAINLHKQYQLPYSQIEITPMIGGNDTIDETFTLADVQTVTDFAIQNNLGGVHFWSFDRDKDCAPGYASATCNTYGVAGTLGFLNRFLNALAY
ncbi:glycosyl hydrolase family 18 protein [Chitinibacter bivalviorum]|nr:glycosyl hydrolase family 18 protein [Chitinibacter bivalviorum]